MKTIQYLFIAFVLFSCDNLERKVTYFDDGEIKEEYFVDERGRKQGVRKTYYPNGKIHEWFEFKNDLANGVWTDYYESGKREQISHFKNNRLDGEVKLFTPEGKLEYYEFYDNDTVPVIIKDYDYYGHIQKIETRVNKGINTSVFFDNNGRVVSPSNYGEWKWIGKNKIEISLYGGCVLETLYVLFKRKMSDKEAIRELTIRKTPNKFILNITEQDYYKGRLSIVVRDFHPWPSEEAAKKMGGEGYLVDYYFQIDKGEKPKKYNADYIEYE